MKRLRIKNEIHIASKTLGRYTSTEMYTWGEVKDEIARRGLTLEDTDILCCEFEEGYEESNSSNEYYYTDDKYTVSIIRYRDETDEEMEKRKKSWEKAKAWQKKQKYQEYLKLKEEFEPETTTTGDKG